MKKVIYTIAILFCNFSLCFSQVDLIPFFNHNKFYKTALDYHYSEITDYNYYKNYFAKRCVKTIQMITKKENRTDTTSMYTAEFSDNKISVISYDEGGANTDARNYFFESGNLIKIEIPGFGNTYCKYNNKNKIESIAEVTDNNDTTFVGKYFYKNNKHLVKTINISRNYRGEIKYDTTKKFYVYRLNKKAVDIYEHDTIIMKFRIRRDSAVKFSENNEDGYELHKFYYLKNNNNVLDEISYSPNKGQVQDSYFDLYYYQDGNLKFKSLLSTDKSTQNIINYDYYQDFLIGKKAKLFDDNGLETYYSKYNYTFYDCSCVTDSSLINKKYLVVSLFYNKINISDLTGKVIDGSVFDTTACFQLQLDTITCLNNLINLNKGCLIFDIDTLKEPLDLSIKSLNINPISSIPGNDLLGSTLTDEFCDKNKTVNHWFNDIKKHKTSISKLNIEDIRLINESNNIIYKFPSLSFNFFIK